MFGVICIGDKNESGGIVETGSTTRFMMARGVARQWDKVTCPKHQKDFPDNYIAEGDPSKLVDGIPVALDGMRCQCGCRLISSLSNAGRR